MKKFKVFLFALLLCVLALPVFAQDEVDIFGYYTIVTPTKDFSDISMIHLAGSYGETLSPPVYGLIRMKKRIAKDFQLLKPTLDGKNLSFKSKPVGGVHYEFSGTFTRLGNFPETQPNGEVLLTGKLLKYRGKLKIAEANVRFSYLAGD